MLVNIDILKTVLNGLLTKINTTKIDRSEVEAKDAVEIATKAGLVSPVAAEDGSVYTDENGVLYSL